MGARRGVSCPGQRRHGGTDMPFIGGGHWWLLLILLAIVLIIWGPGKLPDVGSGLGRAIREFRKASSETKEEFAKATRPEPTTPAPAATIPEPVPVAAPAPSPAADPVAPRDPTTPETAAQAVPGTLAYPAPIGT